MLIDNVINAQIRLLQPQVISPVTLVETLRVSLLSRKIPLFMQGLSTLITQIM